MGVDAIEIYSELNKDIKISLLNKIRNYSNENKRTIPIIHNLSYFKTIINKIYSNEKSNSNNYLNIFDDNIIKLSEINLCEGEDVFFFNNLEDINEFNFMINENFKSKDLLEDDRLKQFHSNLSVNNLYSYNNINTIKEKNEMKILCENIANESETMDINPNFKEKIEFDMNSYINQKNDIDNTHSNYTNLNNNLQENIIYSSNNNLILQENLNIYNDDNNHTHTDLTNLLKSGFFGNSNKIYFCTDPPLKNLNFEKGDLIHLNYGDLTLIVDEIYEKNIKCRGLNTGIVKNGCNFSVEGKDHFLHDLIQNDEKKLIEEVSETMELDFDYLVMSTICDPIKEIELIIN